jgi:alpha-beta hydrolase superfamily lysophospholipase
MAKTKSWRTSAVKYHFTSQGFEFVFQWILGMQTHGASEVGESFFAASQITDGDPASWVKAWQALAERVEARATSSFERGHFVSAREAYLRAYTYYRAALAFIDPFAESKVMPLHQHAVRCFRLAARLLEPPPEVVEIPFEGNALPGYFFKPLRQSGREKTLLMIGGADTFVEDLYFFVGPAALKRDYNLLIVDLPGQGALPYRGLTWRPDAETPMAAVLDYLLARPDVDPDRLAAFGISGGGYLVPRAATADPRIRACVACSSISDFYAYTAQSPAMLRLARNEQSWLTQLLVRRHRLAPSLLLLKAYVWRWGVHSLAELVEAMRPYHFDPAGIACPLLILIGEKEFHTAPASRKQQEEALAQATSPRKELILTSASEGADAHAIATNMSLMAQLVFDWLDETWSWMQHGSSSLPSTSIGVEDATRSLDQAALPSRTP